MLSDSGKSLSLVSGLPVANSGETHAAMSSEAELMGFQALVVTRGGVRSVPSNTTPCSRNLFFLLL